MNTACLACSVRGCGLPLERRGRVLTCAAGHAFDVARAGYVNLLQPQDRRAKRPGDSVDAVAARQRLIAEGIGRDILDAVAAEAEAVGLTSGSVVLDLGAGTGELLAGIARTADLHAIGIDLSMAAVERAARRFPAVTWVVANADRRLPIISSSVSLILSMHARRNPAECLRVLAPDGRLVVVVPGSDDLTELRAFVGGQTLRRTPAETVLREHAGFTLIKQRTFRESHHLKREMLLDLLRATYRGARRSAALQVEVIDELDVTLVSDLLMFTPSSSSPPTTR